MYIDTPDGSPAPLQLLTFCSDAAREVEATVITNPAITHAILLIGRGFTPDTVGAPPGVD